MATFGDWEGEEQWREIESFEITSSQQRGERREMSNEGRLQVGRTGGLTVSSSVIRRQRLELRQNRTELCLVSW